MRGASDEDGADRAGDILSIPPRTRLAPAPMSVLLVRDETTPKPGRFPKRLRVGLTGERPRMRQLREADLQFSSIHAWSAGASPRRNLSRRQTRITSPIARCTRRGQRGVYTRWRYSGLTSACVVRPLGFEPRTCGLREASDRSDRSADVANGLVSDARRRSPAVLVGWCRWDLWDGTWGVHRAR